MKELWRDKLIQIDPYVPGEQPKNDKIIKLNANENPYPPSPKVLEAIQGFDGNLLRKYPSFSCSPLREALAEYHNLPMEQVFTGNGSDDVLALCFLAFFNSKKPILFPDITYSFYNVWCKIFYIPYETPGLNDAFRIHARDYDRENGGVVLPNPNAPTGISEGLEFIEDILKHNADVIVIIDEAYIDFGGKSSIELLKKYDNLVIVQTFSKSRSLAGLRVGAAFARPYLIQALEAVKNSFNSYPMSSITLAAATASVKDEDYFQKTLASIIQTRETTSNKLKELGFTVCPSHSNFLFVTHPTHKAVDIFEFLKRKDIFVRYFKLPRIENYLRITIGTDEEMSLLIQALKEM